MVLVWLSVSSPTYCATHSQSSLRCSLRTGTPPQNVEDADHEVTDLDEKVPEYIDDETIISVAEKYVEKPDSGVINLNRPGERDWMQEDPMEPYRERFEETYNAAVAAVSEVFEETFADEIEVFQEEALRKELSERIIESLDVFTWEILRTQTPDEADSDRIVAEWVVSDLYTHALAEAALEWTEDERLTESPELIEPFKSLRSNLDEAQNEADLAEYDGYMNTRSVLSSKSP